MRIVCVGVELEETTLYAAQLRPWLPEECCAWRVHAMFTWLHTFLVMVRMNLDVIYCSTLFIEIWPQAINFYPLLFSESALACCHNFRKENRSIACWHLC
ncbi:hypothetical protein ABZP36_002145 [Zizania latifolia]